jgi:hypothetical protein
LNPRLLPIETTAWLLAGGTRQATRLKLNEQNDGLLGDGVEFLRSEVGYWGAVFSTFLYAQHKK